VEAEKATVVRDRISRIVGFAVMVGSP